MDAESPLFTETLDFTQSYRVRNSSSSSSASKHAVYRLYNPNSGEHHYILITGERNLLKDAGWRYEGIAWQAPTSSSAPVYRL